MTDDNKATNQNRNQSYVTQFFFKQIYVNGPHCVTDKIIYKINLQVVFNLRRIFSSCLMLHRSCRFPITVVWAIQTFSSWIWLTTSVPIYVHGRVIIYFVWKLLCFKIWKYWHTDYYRTVMFRSNYSEIQTSSYLERNLKFFANQNSIY